MNHQNLPALALIATSVLGLPFQAQAMTWAELGQQGQPPRPAFQTPQPQPARFWPPRRGNGPSRAEQPPPPLLYWSQYQVGLYDNPWTPGWRDGWWAPPVHWGTPLAPWTQQQLYQWWSTQLPHPVPSTTTQP